MDVAAWLKDLGLERYEQVFRENAVDIRILPKLTAEDLKDLGVVLVGHRRTLLDAIAVLDAGCASTAQSPPSLTTAPAGGERRQVTVLFADLVGFTALSQELDAEALHALLERFFDRVDHVIEEHNGHIDKHIGDCVMAVFGAPVAHDNDAERAVRAALAIRDAMADFAASVGPPTRVHIGIASGEVVGSYTGSASHREYTVTGETVNLASRLTDAAAPNEILISEKVRHHLTDRLACDKASALAVKGFAEPVQAWRLLGVQAAEPGSRPPDASAN